VHWRLPPLGALALALLLAPTARAGDPAVLTHVTDPAMPGKLSVVVGDGWEMQQPVLKVMSLPNATPGEPGAPFAFSAGKASELPVAKNDAQTLVCEFPSGKFAVQAIAALGRGGWGEPVIVNRAKIQWLSKANAQPGEMVRAIGRNLVNLDLYPPTDPEGKPAGFGEYLDKAKTSILLQRLGGKFVHCAVLKRSAYDVHFQLPATLPAGAYRVFAHNGLGGRHGWSEPVELNVKSAKPWPNQVFKVTDYGATGLPLGFKEGWHDDTAGMQQALDAAKANGGGIVFVPAGNYLVTATLVIPPYTVLRGESRERCWIWFPDGIDHGKMGDHETPQKIQVGLRGVSDFALENLSIHSVYTKMLVAAPLSKDMAGTYEDLDDARAQNVTIANCYLVHEPTYRYTFPTRENDSLLNKSALRDESWGRMATLSLRGDNLSVTDCTIRGGGTGIALLACRNTTVARNDIRIGRGGNAVAAREGGYPAQPLQGETILEDNRIWSASDFSHSGFWCHATSRNFYIARNSLQLGWNSDAEGLLWHGFGPQQIFAVSSAGANTVTIANKDDKLGVNWECVVVKGRGLGQRRMITAIAGSVLTLDEPWKVRPEASSKIATLYWPCHRGHIVVGNRLSDTGAAIFSWGDNYDWIVDGNRMQRGGGVLFDVCSFTEWGYRPWSGNFFVQVLNNVADQGRFMGKYVEQNWTIGYTGTGYYRKDLRGTIGDLGHVYRGNLHKNDSTISFWDRVHDDTLETYNGPVVDLGMVVEANRFEDCKFGISVGEGVSVVVRGNQFRNVDTPTRFKVGKPAFGMGPGDFVDTLRIALRKPGSGDVQIHYTLDGTLPTTAAPLYTAPLRLDHTATVQARAFRGTAGSEVASRSFRKIELQKPVSVVHVNFGPADAPAAEGFLPDTGAPFGPRVGGVEFGWSQENSEGVRRRGLAEDPLLDTLGMFRKGVTWECAVSNGDYEVVVVLGDAEYGGDAYELELEGISICKGLALAAGEFKLFAQRVGVRDGRLTLRSGENHTGPGQTRINHLEIRRVGDAGL
jgi:hypothetical protein